MLNKILEWLSGKKTYIVSTLAIILGIYYQNMELIMTGLIGLGLRNAIK